MATPQRFRPEIVMAAAMAGKHVLAEKPLALTPADAQAMIDAARTNGVTLATVHNYHFMPVYRDIKEVLDSGRSASRRSRCSTTWGSKTARARRRTARAGDTAPRTPAAAC